MLRIVSANLNGIRSATNKGFFEWMVSVSPDVVCVQELRAQVPDLSEQMRAPQGYYGFFHTAQKKGYSGVGAYCRREPDAVIEGLGIQEMDREGRYLRVDFGNLSVISIYLPSGSSSEARQSVKLAFMAHFLPHLAELKASKRDIIICGDWNIAHQQIDIKNWRSNQKNSGFLPEERAWLSEVLGQAGWVDVWRLLYPEVPGYTWWSQRGQAYGNDVGWRIDYHIVTPKLAATASHALVYKEAKFSDHAPLLVDYAL